MLSGLGCQSSIPKQEPFATSAERTDASDPPLPPAASAASKAVLPWPENVLPITSKLDAEMFPLKWRVPPISAEARPVGAYAGKEMESVATFAAGKYPPAIIHTALDRAYVVSRVAASGVWAGGLSSHNRIYLVPVIIRGVIDREESERGFHHEFSSVIMRTYEQMFPTDAWKACNPPGHAYDRDVTKGTKSGASDTILDPETAPLGFINAYATYNLEDDFNCISAELFLNRPEFWAFVDRFPKVHAKVDLAIEFYTRIDPRMTKEFFLSLPRIDTHRLW